MSAATSPRPAVERSPSLLAEGIFPPPPHDPRERELTLRVDGWDVRLFNGRKFQYFVTRGFWHLQFWHPEAQVSILTPSRLTGGFYEACPVSRWKAQALTYDRLVTLLAGLASAAPPSRAHLERLERSLVDQVVRASRHAGKALSA